jgi:hypothetical protein
MANLSLVLFEDAQHKVLRRHAIHSTLYEKHTHTHTMDVKKRQSHGAQVQYDYEKRVKGDTRGSAIRGLLSARLPRGLVLPPLLASCTPINIFISQNLPETTNASMRQIMTDLLWWTRAVRERLEQQLRLVSHVPRPHCIMAH